MIAASLHFWILFSTYIKCLFLCLIWFLKCETFSCVHLNIITPTFCRDHHHHHHVVVIQSRRVAYFKDFICATAARTDVRCWKRILKEFLISRPTLFGSIDSCGWEQKRFCCLLLLCIVVWRLTVGICLYAFQ